MRLTLADAEALVREVIYVDLTVNQFNALASLARSIGEYNFRRSKIVNLININNRDSIREATKLFTTYGKPTKNNLKQREADRKLFAKPEMAVNNKELS